MNLVAQMMQVKAGLTAPGAPFELISIEKGGETLQAYKNAPKNLVDVVNAARRDDDECFLVYQGERWSFKKFFTEADALASWLHNEGVKKGQRVAIAMRNRPEWCVAFVATALIGAIPAPLNSFGLGEELNTALEDIEPAVLVCDSDRLKRLAKENSSPAYKVLLVGEAVSGIDSTSYGEAAQTTGELPEVKLKDDDPALVLFTSGATSRAKAVVSSQMAVSQALFNIDYISAISAMTSPDVVKKIQAAALPPVILTAVPLFHVSGLHAQFLTALRTGRRLVFMHRWEPETALETIKEEKVTQFNGAPSMVMQLLREPGFQDKQIMEQFAGLGFGGAGIPASLIGKVLDAMPEQMVGNGFGMTECNGAASAISGELFRLRPRASGLITPIAQVRIRSLDGGELDVGETGEIQIKGVTVMEGYLNNPAETAEAISEDGWLRTGDLGYVDEDGFLFIVDRLKDVINRSGENIAAAEVESCLLHHELVIEAAVFGIPDEETGEAVVAVVHLKSGEEVSEQELQRFVSGHLATYKVPAKIQIIEKQLPRNSAGKLLKVKLKKEIFA